MQALGETPCVPIVPDHRRPVSRRPSSPKPPRLVAPGKLSYRERRALERLPARIEELEQRQREVHDLAADLAFYKQEPAAITRRLEKSPAFETEQAG